MPLPLGAELEIAALGHNLTDDGLKCANCGVWFYQIYDSGEVCIGGSGDGTRTLSDKEILVRAQIKKGMRRHSLGEWKETLHGPQIFCWIECVDCGSQGRYWVHEAPKHEWYCGCSKCNEPEPDVVEAAAPAPATKKTKTLSDFADLPKKAVGEASGEKPDYYAAASAEEALEDALTDIGHDPYWVSLEKIDEDEWAVECSSCGCNFYACWYEDDEEWRVYTPAPCLRTYRVTVTRVVKVRQSNWLDVEAENEEEALKQVRDTIENGDIDANVYGDWEEFDFDTLSIRADSAEDVS
jgi:hypothetical protein